MGANLRSIHASADHGSDAPSFNAPDHICHHLGSLQPSETPPPLPSPPPSSSSPPPLRSIRCSDRTAALVFRRRSARHPRRKLMYNGLIVGA